MNFRFPRRLLSSVLSGQRDRFGGVAVHSSDYIGLDTNTFDKMLKTSLKEWHETGVRGLWFHVENEELSWASSLLKNGFQFHHAKKNKAVLGTL